MYLVHLLINAGVSTGSDYLVAYEVVTGTTAPGALLHHLIDNTIGTNPWVQVATSIL